MRINEFTSAEEQLALWKLISDNTWTAISQQAEAERRQRAEKAAQSKTRAKRGGKLGGRKVSTPPPRITPHPNPSSPPSPNAQAPSPNAQQKDGSIKQHQANTAIALPQTTLSTVPVTTATVKQQQTTPQAVKLQSPYSTQQPLKPQQQQALGNVAAITASTRKI
jgi:hypothetical protein